MSRDTYADYLKRKVASSQRVDAKYEKSMAESKALGAPAGPQQDKTIRLNFDEDNRDIAGELEGLLQGFFEPAVARRLMQSDVMSEAMLQYLVDFWASDIAPGLASFRGKTRNVASIVALLKRQFNRAENTTREAEAYQAGDGVQNNLWRAGRATFSQEEKGVFTQLVFEAKALVNSEKMGASRFAGITKAEIADAILRLFEIDRTLDLLAPHLRASVQNKVGTSGYASDVQGVKAVVRKDMTTAKPNTTAVLNLALNEYQDDIRTYATLLQGSYAWTHFNLAREIFKNEKSQLASTLNQLIQKRAPVFSDGSQLTQVDGSRVPCAATTPASSSGSAVPLSKSAAVAAAPVNSMPPPPPRAPFSRNIPPPPPKVSRGNSGTLRPTTRPIDPDTDDDGVWITPSNFRNWGSPIKKGGQRVADSDDDPGNNSEADPPFTLRGSGLGVQAFKRGEHILNERYYLNTNKLLRQGVLDIRYIKNRHLVPVKMRAVSPLFRDLVMARVQGDHNVDRAKYAQLTDTEQHLFRAIGRYLDIDGGALPDNSEQLSERLQVLLGSIRAGQNNPEVKREAYLLLHHHYMMHKLSSSEFNAAIRAYGL